MRSHPSGYDDLSRRIGQKAAGLLDHARVQVLTVEERTGPGTGRRVLGQDQQVGRGVDVHLGTGRSGKGHVSQPGIALEAKSQVIVDQWRLNLVDGAGRREPEEIAGEEIVDD